MLDGAFRVHATANKANTFLCTLAITMIGTVVVSIPAWGVHMLSSIQFNVATEDHNVQ